MADLLVPNDTRQTHLEVLISGSTLSFLTFKLKNCQGDTEGFLYGHVNTRVTQEVSDTQEEYESIQKTITITDFICFKNKFTFYDKCGRLDTSKCARVECLTSGTVAHSRTVGWFSFRRNTTSGMSIREKFIHQDLKNLFTPAIDTFLHLLLIETLSNQLVLEQLSLSVNTYDPCFTGKHILTPHSLKIINLNATNSKNSYKYPIDIAGISLAHSISLDTIITPYSEQIGTKPPFLQSSQMITQISTKTLDRMSQLRGQIISNAGHIDQLKSEIREMSRDTSYPVDLTPSAPPSSILININKKTADISLPQKSAADYNTYSNQDKIINQDPNLAHTGSTRIFPPLEVNPSTLPEQPPPYNHHLSQGYTGTLEIPSQPHAPMDTTSHVALAIFTNNNNNNNNNNFIQTKLSADNSKVIGFYHSNIKVKKECEDESSA
ncbi:BRISC complex subunit Abro1 [Oopsacas minuta]|uniref:BRISC complex subunit Abro1 n=1 Tax=Oopsacas minuta TaxID=111878 RepID=A0AAV7JBV2_9METZ|nr:BRISC complex subunit Abro1 [Oopsacas minuta]